MSLPVDSATLAGLFASSILYGMFTVLFPACLYVLLYHRKTTKPNHFLIIAASIMWMLNTFITALSLSRVLDAFIDVRVGSTADPAVFLGMLSEWKEVARTSATSAYIFVADSTLIYRCWIVWAKSPYIVAVPIVIHLAITGMGILLNVNMAHLPDGATIFDPTVRVWLVTGLGLTLFETIIVTSLIVYKIWSVNSRVTRGKKLGTLGSTVQIIVESGMLYVLTVFVYLVTYAAGSNAQYVMIDIVNPVIGITFSLLVVRVAIKPSPNASSLDEGVLSSHGHRMTRTVVVAVEQTTFVDQRDYQRDSVSDLEEPK